jgi:hypothetical protein
MLALLRLPFNRSRDSRVVSAGAPPIRFFFLLKNYGAPPLARTRVKRRQMPAPTERSPRSSALPRILKLRSQSSACADPLFERPLRAGDPPPLRDMKRQDMAQAAEQLLVATAWLPALLRTPPAGQGSAEHEQAEL